MTLKKTTAKKHHEDKKSAVREKAASSERHAHSQEPAAEKAVMDGRTGKERRSNGGGDRRKKSEPVPVQRRQMERRAKVNRRRQIDPTTCERDYSADEVEFMSALDDYKRRSGRMFPTCSEVLEVIRGLGYEKHTATVVSLPSSGEMPNLTTSMESAV